MSIRDLSEKALNHFTKPFQNFSGNHRLGFLDDLKRHPEEVVEYVQAHLLEWAVGGCVEIGEVISVDVGDDTMAREFVDHLKKVFADELEALPA